MDHRGCGCSALSTQCRYEASEMRRAEELVLHVTSCCAMRDLLHASTWQRQQRQS